MAGGLTGIVQLVADEDTLGILRSTSVLMKLQATYYSPDGGSGSLGSMLSEEVPIASRGAGRRRI